jgi:hypothetical protein
MTSWLRLNPWPAFGLGLVLLTTAMVSLGVRQRVNTAQNRIRATERSIAQASTAPGRVPTKMVVPNPRHELPSALEPPIAESSSSPRFDFDSSLEHGRPLPTDRREVGDTKATY